MAVVWIVGLVVLVASVTVVLAEAFGAYRVGGTLERRLKRLEDGQREILAELRRRSADREPGRSARTAITLLEVRVPRTGRPEFVEVTQWMHGAPPHADSGRLRAITSDYLASAMVDPSWDSVTARWAISERRAEDVGSALHGALLGIPVTTVREVSGVPEDLPSALSMVPPQSGARLVTVARVAGVVVGPGTDRPMLTAASFKSLVRSDLTDIIGRAIGDGLFVDRPERASNGNGPPVSAWPFTDDDR